MPRAYLLLLLGVSAFAWPEPPASPESAPVERVRRRMAENIAHLPNYTCLETIERSVNLPNKGKPLFRDRIHLDVAFIGQTEMFAWPGSNHFEAGLLHELPLGTGAIGNGGFGGWVSSLFGPSAPVFTPAGACMVEGRRGLRYSFHVPLRSSTHIIVIGDRQAISAYTGSICVDADGLDIMTLEVDDEQIPAPLVACSERVRYGRTRVGAGDFLLPQYDELSAIDSQGNQSRNRTSFTGCEQYTSHSSISFDTEHESAPEPREAARVRQKTTGEIELSGGISLDLKLETPITFEASAVGDAITAQLHRRIRASGVSIPKDANVSGRIRALEQYFEPKKDFIVGLEFFSLSFNGKQALFRARLVGPHLQAVRSRLGDTLPGGDDSGGPVAVAPDETSGLDILPAIDSAPGCGLFRVPGASLNLTRGLRMIFETEGGKP
jgi:hypothetical protein